MKKLYVFDGKLYVLYRAPNAELANRRFVDVI
jgi:hypothetical protein